MNASQPVRTRRAAPFRFLFRVDWLQWIGFLLIVAGVRLWLVDQYGSAIPIHDQWDDEAARIFKPYLEGTLGIRQLLEPHNEHRPVLGRLLALALLICNGQWDARVQMAVNALLATSLALFVAVLGVRLLGTKRRPIVLAAVACWSCFPYAWENTTWGFQSSFYFLILLSLGAMAGLIARPSLSGHWWCAAGAALLACFTMASGFLCAAAVLAVLGVRCLSRREISRADVGAALLLVCLIGLGLMLREHVPGHNALRAASVQQWVDAVARCLAWPFTRYAAACVLVCLPTIVLAGFYLWKSKADLAARGDMKSEIVLAVALWVALQAAAIAFGRGRDLANFVPPRYLDVLGLGALANFFALFLLSSRLRLRGRTRLVLQLLGSAWAAGMFIAVALAAHEALGHMRGRPDYLQRAQEHVRAYVATGDASHLANEFVQAAYPWPEHLAALLNDPTIRRILPAALRMPLKLEPEGASDPFSPQTRSPGERMWTSGPDDNEAVGVLQTRAIYPSLPYLWFELHGPLAPGVSLRLEDAGSGSRHRIAFDPDVGGWRAGYARAPRQMRLIARDKNTKRALTFTEPREVGRLSYVTEGLLPISFKILLTGVALVIAGIVSSHIVGHRHYPHGNLD